MFRPVVLLSYVTVSSMLFMTALSAAASTVVSIALCPVSGQPDQNIGDGNAEQVYFAADGSRQRLSISQDDNMPPSCSTLALQFEGGILWAAPATPEQNSSAVRQVGLLGDFATDNPTVSEVIVIADVSSETASDTDTPESTEMPPLPLDRSVLSQFTPRPFGLDERVTIDGPAHLVCEPGENIAGVLLSAGRPWASAMGLQLEIRARGHGRFYVALGDTRRDLLQTPLRVGEMLLSEPGAGGDIGDFSFGLPDNNQSWTSLTIICPGDPGELELLSLTLSTPQGRLQREQREQQLTQPLRRGAWLWSPQLWEQSADFIWRVQAQQQLTEIYISIPINDNGDVADPEMLTQFVTQAGHRELDVWVVIGDPRDVLPASLAALEARINAFMQYNQNAPEFARLSGVQLDIEPYLLRGFSRAQAYWRDRYVSVIRRVHDMLDGRLPLDLVMPAWWGSHQAWGEQFFGQLPVDNTRLSIMNYHTSIGRLRANAEPFLNWGQRASVPVVMALESGALPDETHHRYTRDEQAGELWLLPVGDESIFVLFDTPQSDLPGQAFAFAFDYPVPASNYTFKGDVARLNTVVSELVHEWQAWTSFAGIAIHGLDDIRVSEGAQ